MFIQMNAGEEKAGGKEKSDGLNKEGKSIIGKTKLHFKRGGILMGRREGRMLLPSRLQEHSCRCQKSPAQH